MEKVKSLTNKAKDAVSSDKSHSTTTHGTTTTGTTGYGTHTGSTNAGPHDSNLGNKADPRIDSDLDGSRNAGAASHTATTGHTGVGYGNTTTTTGGGLSGHNTRSTNVGPHDSNLANKADPRIDSDLDGSRNLGATSTTATHGHTGHTGAGYGNTTTTGAGLTGHNTRSTNAGPHDSNLANKADPRVDSDRDGSRNFGAASHGTTTGHTGAGYGTTGTTGHTGTGYGTTGTTGHTGTGYGTTGTTGHTGTGYGHTTTGYSGSTNAGPHDSNLANKADPRVDSDRDGSRNLGAASHTTTTGHTGAGYGTTGHTGTGYGTTGHTGTGLGHTTTGYSGSTNAGPHDSNLANKADPRIDSDRDGSRNLGAAGNTTTTGRTGAGYGGTGVTGHTAGAEYSAATGPASKTAGPHSSNVLNQLDPRVDSDLSKTGSRREL